MNNIIVLFKSCIKRLKLLIIIEWNDWPVQPEVWRGNDTGMKLNMALSCAACHLLLLSGVVLVPSLMQLWNMHPLETNIKEKFGTQKKKDVWCLINVSTNYW